MNSAYFDVPDEVWDRVKVWIPERTRSPNGGRRFIDDRRVFRGIVYRLKTGCQWAAIPAEFGSGSTCRRRFIEWRDAGVFHMLHTEMLLYYDAEVGLDLSWCSIDSATVKAPKGGTSLVPIRPIAGNSGQNATF